MKNANLIVIKIGTSVITDSSGALDLEVIDNIAKQIAEAKNNDRKFILVTSGAIGAGMGELNLSSRPDNIIMRQVCAAVGQSILMLKYHDIFAQYGIKVAQVLISYDTFENKNIFVNMSNSINKLLELGIIPIVNENDAISTEEIGKSFGDNDIMSAKLAVKIKADLLIILTDVDGLFDRNPKEGRAILIKEVSKIDERMFNLAGKSTFGVGGMKTKLKAVKIAAKAGMKAIIANGRKKNVLTKILNGEKEGSLFVVIAKNTNK